MSSFVWMCEQKRIAFSRQYFGFFPPKWRRYAFYIEQSTHSDVFVLLCTTKNSTLKYIIHWRWHINCKYLDKLTFLLISSNCILWNYLFCFLLKILMVRQTKMVKTKSYVLKRGKIFFSYHFNIHNQAFFDWKCLKFDDYYFYMILRIRWPPWGGALWQNHIAHPKALLWLEYGLCGSGKWLNFYL